VVRCDDGRRTLAIIEDADVLATLEREEMVGAPGVLRRAPMGETSFRCSVPESSSATHDA
jgi:hypothetical protein